MKQFFLNLWAKILELVFRLDVYAGEAFVFIVYKQPLYSKLALTVLTYFSLVLMTNWIVAAIFLAGIFIHEQGHVLALDLLNITNKGFFPIPFLGGVTVFSSKEVKTYQNNFIIAIFGPIIGAAFGGILLIGYCATHWNWLGGAAGLMIVLNLFNLLPIVMLDGGRMYDSIVSGLSDKHKKISYSVMSAAVLALGLMTWKSSVTISVIMIVGAAVQFFTKVRKENHNVDFEPIKNPVIASACVVAYMVSILVMLAMLLPLVKVDFVALFG